MSTGDQSELETMGPDPGADTTASEADHAPTATHLTHGDDGGPVLQPGDRLGDYELLRKLGAGAMGDVFAARHERTDEVVALKLLSTTTATRLYRFKREFRTLADISHHNLIRLYELVVPAEGPPFFTMELLDGRHFVDWVRGMTPPGRPPDIDRLEEGLRQLVEGIHYLHAHQYIHRDLKPANVLVTTDDRVVVLDFGLVSELSSLDGGVTRDRQILGTPSFMAPEQATGDRVGPPADYYAVGVMLFQCLTGSLPFKGPALQQLVAKQGTPPDPGDRVDGLPDGLRTLCIRLLAREPEARPGGRELLGLLRGSNAPAGPASIFVGRTQELATLRGALREVSERQGPVLVRLRGRSGDGKSALMRRFRAGLAEPAVVVLHGRCRERETVPYKGIDAVVDALSAHLRSLPEDQRLGLRPPDLHALVRLFPVLDEIWEPAALVPLDLPEVRKLGAVTLRKLLEQLARIQPLVVHIDDFQWADLDSVSLLQALVRPPDPPALLLVLSHRTEVEDSEALRALEAHEPDAPTHTIELGPLSAADARALAHALLQAEGGADPQPQRTRAETIALRSRGSPFFIAQMAMGGTALDTSESNLDQIMVRRLSDLDGDARRLLEVVAVFGGPLPTHLALELCSPGAEAALRSLCEMGLLVRDEDSGGEAEDRVEAAHDRVREVVLEELSAPERVRLHAELGEHLLAHHRGDPRGDDIFAVVNQLDAGMGDPAALSAERRLELAELNHRAGQRALDATAWITARRYLGCAYELARPWLPEARQGQGHHALCLAVAFGRAQIEFMLENAEGDAAIEELLGWSLSMEDYCRIAQWYCWNLSLRARLADCVEFGLRALDHIGFRVPSRPSWPRAILSYLRGWRAVWRRGIDEIGSLPQIADARVHAGMDILAAAAAYSSMVDVKLHLALSGIHGRLLTRHGFHDGAGVALAALAMSAAARGKIQQARELCEVVQGFTDHRELSTFAQYGPQAIILSVLPSLFPLREVMRDGDAIYHRASEIASQTLVEAIGLSCAANRYFASVPLASLMEFIETLEATHDGFELSWVGYLSNAFRYHARTLLQGPSDADGSKSMTGHFEGPAEVAVIATASVSVMQLEIAILLGHQDRAWELTRALARDYQRDIGYLWHAAAYGMYSVIVMADRWPSCSPAERRRMHRTMRKRLAAAHRWAERCPENYQPMLHVIEGELAALRDHYDEAVSAYERARSSAARHEVLRLVGLASERFARLARRRGQALVADAALRSAREAYEAWGATAVVRRLEHERSADASGASTDSNL